MAEQIHNEPDRSLRSNPTGSTRLIPVPRWNNHHDWPPPGGMRHLIFHADSNGFKTAFKRVGRRVLVDEMEFFRCVDQKNVLEEQVRDRRR